MRFVLDTNALSALMKGEPKAVARLLIACARSDVALPEPVAAEIAYGIARLPVGKKRSLLQARFQFFREELDSASWTSNVSEHFGEVKAALEKRGTLVEALDVGSRRPHWCTRQALPAYPRPEARGLDRTLTAPARLT